MVTMVPQKIKNLAKDLYEGETRLSEETYYDYALDIVKRLKKYSIRDETTLTIAFLHDALSVSPKKSIKKIEELAGSEIVALLERYGKLKETKIKTENLRDFNEKYLNQTLINLVEDVRLLIVRLVVKAKDLDNCQMFDKEKREEMAIRALYLYAPLAKVLGVSNISKDLENAAFKILYPEEYFEIKKIIKKRSWGTKKIFADIKKVLSEILTEQGMRDFQIQYRTKSPYSTFRKMVRYKSRGIDIGNDLENIYDLFALRVIVRTIEECYLVETLLKQLWNYLPQERDDYIEKPRPTGYRAIHNVFEIDNDLVMEVQIRSHEMHTQAEFGFSSHLLYKIGEKDEKSQAVEEYKKYLNKHPEWFRDLNFLEIQKNKEFVSKTPFSDKVYILTPKGDIIQLPKGATVVDFAYAVHTDIGDRCIGAFVNDKIVKLDYKIETGDVVKIKVNKQRKRPSKDWLNFVKTRRAKNRILKAWRT